MSGIEASARYQCCQTTASPSKPQIAHRTIIDPHLVVLLLVDDYIEGKQQMEDNPDLAHRQVANWDTDNMHD
jgi:hypothetical protein